MRYFEARATLASAVSIGSTAADGDTYDHENGSHCAFSASRGSRAELLALVERIASPILVLYGAETPPKSKAEMEALAVLPNIRVAILPSGKLSVHEEFPDAVANAVKSFLAEGSSLMMTTKKR
jgi:pimeloyl-ACP methyl ester carboxylesterase